jgi:hypothetical protein
LIDFLYRLRAARLEHQKQVYGMKLQEATLKETIMGMLKTGELQGARGHEATASVSETRVTQIPDWESFYDYIITENKPELLQRRPASNLIIAHYDDGIIIPGTSVFTIQDLSLTKATR